MHQPAPPHLIGRGYHQDLVLPGVAAGAFDDAPVVDYVQRSTGTTKPPTSPRRRRIVPGPLDPLRWHPPEQLSLCEPKYAPSGCSKVPEHWHKRQKAKDGSVFTPGSYMCPIGRCAHVECFGVCGPQIQARDHADSWAWYFDVPFFTRDADQGHITAKLPASKRTHASVEQLKELATASMELGEDMLREHLGLKARAKSKKKTLKDQDVVFTYATRIHPADDAPAAVNGRPQAPNIDPHFNVFVPIVAWLRETSAPAGESVEDRRKRRLRFGKGFVDEALLAKYRARWNAKCEEVLGPFAEGEHAPWHWSYRPSHEIAAKKAALSHEQRTFPGIPLPKSLSRPRYGGGWGPRAWREIAAEMGAPLKPKESKRKKKACTVGAHYSKREAAFVGGCQAPFFDPRINATKNFCKTLLETENLQDPTFPDDVREQIRYRADTGHVHADADEQDMTARANRKRRLQVTGHAFEYAVSALAAAYLRAAIEARDACQRGNAFMTFAELEMLVNSTLRPALLDLLAVDRELHASGSMDVLKELRTVAEHFISEATKRGVGGPSKLSWQRRRERAGGDRHGFANLEALAMALDMIQGRASVETILRGVDIEFAGFQWPGSEGSPAERARVSLEQEESPCP